MSMAWYKGEDNPMSPYFDAAKYPEADMVCEGCLTTFPESEVTRCELSGNWYCPQCIEEEKKAALTEAAFNNN